MTLGQNITALRTKAKMSQGDLAEKLNVSRQSVSKWETDASVPELDKLLLLSEIFGITLDELVKGEKPEAGAAETPEEASHAEKPAESSTRKTVGYIFLAAGLLCCILGVVFSGVALAVGVYLLTVGIVCLVVRRYAALVIGWLTILPAFRFSAVTAISNLFALLNPPSQSGGTTAWGILGIGLWLALAVMIVFTVRAIKKRREK